MQAFSTDAVAAVVDSYLPLVEKHKDDPVTQKQKEWQQLRRGRCECRLRNHMNDIKLQIHHM